MNPPNANSVSNHATKYCHDCWAGGGHIRRLGLAIEYTSIALTASTSIAVMSDVA